MSASQTPDDEPIHPPLHPRGVEMGYRTVASALAASTRRHPSRLALEFDRGSLTYSLMDELAERLANGLIAAAETLRPTIAILSENNLEHALVLVAGAKAGFVISSLNWRWGEDELREAVEVISPDLVIVSERFMDLCESWIAPYRRDRKVVWISAAGKSTSFGLHFWSDIIDQGRRGLVDPLIQPEDIATLVFTSGSVGAPKAAAISHRALVARSTVMAAELRLSPAEAFIAWAPFCHMVSSDYLLIQLIIGAPVVIVDGFQASALCRILRRRAVGWLPVMPGSYEDLLSEVKRQGRPRSLRAIGAMADLLAPDLIARVTTETGAAFFNSFGSTEAGTLPAPSTLIPVGEVPKTLRKRQSAFCDVRIVTGDGSEAPNEVQGELLLRGPTLFSGYWFNNVATIDDLTEDNWYRTGDIFVRHDDGSLDFIDRRKYLIKSGGENVSPAELERVLLSHPGVKEASVVRAPDSRWGERPIAFVARSGVGEPTESELIELCATYLGRFKRPRQVVFIEADEFPRNVTGKIVRRELEDRYSTGSFE